MQLNILKKHSGIPEYSIYEDICVDKALGMLASYPIEKKIDRKKILYTSDFSDRSFPLIEKYSLPNIEDLDLLIINSTNAFKKEDS